MWSLKLKSKMLISLVAALIVADLFIGMPTQTTAISVSTPSNSSLQVNK